MSSPAIDVFRTSCGAVAPLELKVSGPGNVGNERRVFENSFVLIGRQEHNGLRLEDDAVSRRHAYLQQFGERVFCMDLGSRTGIRWGGELRPAGWLHPRQCIQIGPFTLELAGSSKAGETSGDRGAEDWDPLQDRAGDTQHLPRITLEEGNKVLSRFYMNRALVLVGNAPACRIRLRDAAISKYHCSLVRTPQGVWLIDLLSDNGARLNGQSPCWALLKEGDRLQVGPYGLRVWYPGGVTETPLSRPGEIVTVQNQVREPQREVETLRRQLADRQAEYDRHREQVQAYAAQLAEMANLQDRLQAAETSIGELETVRGERDRWQAEVRDQQAHRAAESAEHEERHQREVAVLGEQLAETRAEYARLRSRLPHLESRADAADHLEAQLQDAGAETDWLRQQLHASELRAAEGESVRGERDRLVEQVHSLEIQVSEIAGLQQRLEAAHASAGELETLRDERDRWQAEAQDLHARFAEVSAEREEEYRRRETAQQQLVEEREAARALQARLDKECDSLERLQADLTVRNDEQGAVLQRLQEVQDELAGARDGARGLQAKLDEALKDQQEAAVLGEHLAEVWAEHAQLCCRFSQLESRASAADHLEAQLQDAGAEKDRLREQLHAAEQRSAEGESVRGERDRLVEYVNTLTIQVAEMASLQARLTSAEASAGEVETVRGERDRWQAETQDLQTRLAAKSTEHEERYQQEIASLSEHLAQVRAEHSRLCAHLPQLDSRAGAADHLEAQLQETGAERERLLEQVRVLEMRVSEMVSLQSRLTAESNDQPQLDRLSAELHAAQTEQQEARHSAEQAWTRVAALERALTEAAAPHEKALEESRALWETERQALEARHHLGAQGREREFQAALHDGQVRAAAEREKWREQLQGAESQLVWERGMFQEQSEQLRQQAAQLQAERDRLAAQLSQAARAAEPQPSPPTAREPVSVQISEIRSGLVPQSDRAQPAAAPVGQPLPRPPLGRQGGSAEEQRRLAAIAQELQAAWGGLASGPESLPAFGHTLIRLGEPGCEGGLGSGGAIDVEPPAALSSVPAVPADNMKAFVPSDLLDGSAASRDESQPAEDNLNALPADNTDPAEPRQGFFRQILSLVRGK